MKVEIPSNHFSFQLTITVETKQPIFIRLVAYDPNKPATKYTDIQGKVNDNKFHITYFKLNKD